MSWVLYLVLGLAVSWGAYLSYVRLAAKAAEGRSADELHGVLPGLDTSDGGEPALVYCYTPRCGPCKAMTREVEALQAESPRVFKLDISEHLDLAQRMGIRVTPTVLLIRRGRIEQCVVGVKKQAFLRSLLAA